MTDPYRRLYRHATVHPKPPRKAAFCYLVCATAIRAYDQMATSGRQAAAPTHDLSTIPRSQMLDHARDAEAKRFCLDSRSRLALNDLLGLSTCLMRAKQPSSDEVAPDAASDKHYKLIQVLNQPSITESSLSQ